MKKTIAALLLAAGSLALHGNTAAQQLADDSLYRSLGEKAGIALIVDDFVNRMVADQRIAAMFKNTKLPNLKEQLADQFCWLSGGPCKYEGDAMKPVHKDLGITKANFNAVVEMLQLSMDGRGVPFREQNRLLALLAPMNRDIITK